MSFTVYTHDGMKVIQWFSTIDDLLASMIKNPHDRYQRNV